MTEATIKALPLWQPWASLVAIGAKRVETRGYPPHRLGLHYGQRIAIHACKRDSELRLCEIPPFSEVGLPAVLPLGAIVATCTIVRAVEISAVAAEDLEYRNPNEFAFGNYEPGRWAWVLEDVEPITPAVPFSGSQGTFDVPAWLLGLAVETPQGSLL